MTSTTQLDAPTTDDATTDPGLTAGLERDLDLPTAPLRLEGELDLASTDRLRALLDDRVAPGARVELDLTDVTHLSAAALAVLVAAHRKLRERGGALVLGALSPAVERVLRISGLHRVFGTAAHRPPTQTGTTTSTLPVSTS